MDRSSVSHDSDVLQNCKCALNSSAENDFENKQFKLELTC